MPADLIEELLIDWLEQPPPDRARSLEELCRAHPALADDLRERARWLDRLAARSHDEVAGETLGEFRLLRQLGGGGMGIVYLARQQRPGLEREVALKVVRQGGLFSTETRARFEREARAALRLDHPAICPVLDVGEVDGTPYIAMRHVPGETLAAKIADARRRRQPVQLQSPRADDSQRTSARQNITDVVALIETVARALHTAHEAGLVHRDVKPGNIMVTPAGDPVLLDFGLVRDDSEVEALTLTGQAIGTPAYMSPQQVRGQSSGRSTDIYSLGTTLYECLTGRPPFAARTRDALYLAILHDEPPAVRRLEPSVPKDLGVVVATAMQKDPSRRYATALEFAEDLRRVRQVEPILARPAGVARRLLLWCQRNPVATALVACLGTGATALAWQAVHLQRARDNAMVQFRLARDVVDELIHTARQELRDVPRVESVRQNLIERALAFHERFLAERAGDRDLQADLALSHELRGVLLLDISRLAEAEQSLRTAAAQWAGLLAATPDSPELRRRLAHVRAELADARAGRGHPDEAAAILRQVIGALEAMPDRDSRRLLAECLEHLGSALTQTDDHEAAVAALQGSVALQLDLGPDQDAAAAASLAGTRIELAKVQVLTHEFAAATAQFEAAFHSLEQLPPSNRVLGLLALGRRFHGVQLRLRGRLDEARGQYDAALQIQERLAAENPGTPRFALAVADLHNSLGHLLGQADAALPHYQASLAAARRLRLHLPDSIDAAYIEAEAHYNIAGRERQSDLGAAVVDYQTAVAILDPLVLAHPAEHRLRNLLAMALNNLSVMHWEQGDRERAQALLEQALRHKQTLCDRNPDDPQYRQILAIGLGNLAKRKAELGQRQVAAALFERGLALHLELVAAHPQVVEYGADLLAAYLRESGFLEGKAVIAAKAWLDSLPPARLERYATAASFRDRRRRILIGVATLLMRQQDFDQARAALTALLSLHPDDPAALALQQQVEAASRDR